MRPSVYRRFDILAANQQCFALYPGVIAAETLPLNLARFMFLDPRAEQVYPGWDAVADDTVAALRIEADRNPLDRKLSDLVGELATRSDAFRTRWARHNVRHHRTTAKHIHNPVAGDLTLTGDALELPGEDLILITYTAPADSPAQEQLDFLAAGPRVTPMRTPAARNQRRRRPPTADARTSAGSCVGITTVTATPPTGAFPSVATLVRYTGLAERTVRTCLDRLAADGVIAPCDPDIVAARIKRADRRPQGWDLNLSLVRDLGGVRYSRTAAPVSRAGRQARSSHPARCGRS